MKPICVPCRLFFKPRKSGVWFEEGMPDGIGGWKSYKLWVGDLYECRGCGAQTIVGVGRDRVAEHYEPHYADMRAAHSPLLRVDDC